MESKEKETAEDYDRVYTFEEQCNFLRSRVKNIGNAVKSLLEDNVFKGEQSYSGQHNEMKANIMLAYRHLEDARMRVGKILQAAGNGVSILDK